MTLNLLPCLGQWQVIVSVHQLQIWLKEQGKNGAEIFDAIVAVRKLSPPQDDDQRKEWFEDKCRTITLFDELLTE